MRALFFLYAIHRFHLPLKPGLNPKGFVSFDGYEHLLKRRFEEAIAVFREAQKAAGPSDAISSALAAAFVDPALDRLRRNGVEIRLGCSLRAVSLEAEAHIQEFRIAPTGD